MSVSFYLVDLWCLTGGDSLIFEVDVTCWIGFGGKCWNLSVGATCWFGFGGENFNLPVANTLLSRNGSTLIYGGMLRGMA